jgi:hypothetical protein
MAADRMTHKTACTKKNHDDSQLPSNSVMKNPLDIFSGVSAITIRHEKKYFRRLLLTPRR